VKELSKKFEESYRSTLKIVSHPITLLRSSKNRIRKPGNIFQQIKLK